MIKSNYHTHTLFCDGVNTPREMAEQALALGFEQLGFSGHMDLDITMNLAAYDQEIRHLQKEYRGRLDILRGVELDTLFVPRSEEEERLIKEMEYRIGATHFIPSPSGGVPGCVDDTAEKIIRFCKEEFGGDWYSLAKAYYRTEAEVFEKTDCTFIGHFDLVTRFNDREHFLDESDPRYTMPALEVMEYLVSLGIPFEINCGAVNRGRKAELYPNRFLLRNLRKMGGEIIINSDAHQKELLNGGFGSAVRTALDCGFTHTNILLHNPGGKIALQEVPLDVPVS